MAEVGEDMLEDALDDFGYFDEEDVEDIAVFQDIFENDLDNDRVIFPFETNTPDPETVDQGNTSTDETDE